MKKFTLPKLIFLFAVLCAAGLLYNYQLTKKSINKTGLADDLTKIGGIKAPVMKSDVKTASLFNGTGSYNSAASATGQKEIAAEAETLLRKTQNLQRFIENKGQLPAAVKYYTDASGLQLAVTEKSIRIIANKYEGEDEHRKVQSHVVDLSFAGGNKLQPSPVAGHLATYNYMQDEKNMFTGLQSYGELLLPDVYDGVSLRLYSNESGDVEFDWLVNKPEDYKKIKMKFNGQDYLKTTHKGELAVGLRFDEMKLHIPESYQVNRGEKKSVNFIFKTDEGNAAFDLAKNETLLPDAPLVIDPSITYATFFAGDASFMTNSLTSAVAKDAAGNIYAGIFCYNAKITSAYINDAPGYDQSKLNIAAGAPGSSHITCIAKISGNTCTAFTFFGSSDGITSLKLFPDGRVLFGGFVETASGNLIPATQDAYIGNPRPVTSNYLGMLGVLSDDLTTLLYATYLPSVFTNSTFQSGVSFLEILDNDTYFIGSVVTPGATNIPADFISPTSPDITPGNSYEPYIARFSSYSTLDWATYVGGSSIDFLGGLKLTPDKSRLAFCGQSFDKTGWPALSGNNVGSSFSGIGLFLGTVDASQSVPSSFDFLSFITTTGSVQSPKMDVSDGYFYIGYAFSGSANVPGTGEVPAVYDATSNGGFDFVISKIPLDGTNSGTPVRSTYIGGVYNEWCTLGVAANEALDKVYLVGSTFSTDYPTKDIPGSAYFKGNFTTPAGKTDFVISEFSSDLSQLIYSTYIGGDGYDLPWTYSNSQFTVSNTSMDYDPVSDQFTCIGSSDPYYQGGATNGHGNIFGPDSFDPQVPISNTLPFIFTFDGSGGGCPGAGSTAPVLNASSVANTCPATTANLNSLYTGNPPAGGVLVWFTNNTHTGAPYPTPGNAVAGTYYAFYYDAANNCYSPPAAANVFINDCPCKAGGNAPVMSNYNPILTCSETTINLTHLHIGIKPVGSSLLWYTNDTHSGAPYTTPTAATPGTYYAFYYDPINNCFSPPAKVVVDKNFVCSVNDPDLTPTIDIDDLSFNANETRDFILNIFELVNSSSPVLPAVTIRISRLSGWDITVPGLSLNTTGQPGIDGNSDVAGGVSNQNSMFNFSQNAGFITITLRPGKFINSGDYAQIGFSITRKPGTGINTTQNITATILDNSGGDINNTNNRAVVTIAAN